MTIKDLTLQFVQGQLFSRKATTN